MVEYVEIHYGSFNLKFNPFPPSVLYLSIYKASNGRSENTLTLFTQVLARIKFKRPKKHVATTMTHRLGEIFLVKCQKQAFSFNKREAKVYCYAFLHVLKIHAQNMKKTSFFSFMRGRRHWRAGPVH
jgi:hypothetical protein